MRRSGYHVTDHTRVPAHSPQFSLPTAAIREEVLPIAAERFLALITGVQRIQHTLRLPQGQRRYVPTSQPMPQIIRRDRKGGLQARLHIAKVFISLPLPAQRRDIALPLPQYPIRLLHQAFHIAPSPPVRMHAHIAHQADLQGIPTVMAGDKQNRDRRHDPPLLLQGQMQDIMSRLRLVGLRQQLHKIRSLSIHAEYIIDKINQIRIIVPREYLIFHHPRLLLSALILH